MRAQDDASGFPIDHRHAFPGPRATFLLLLLAGAMGGAAVAALAVEHLLPDRLARWEARLAWRGPAPAPGAGARWPAGASAVVVRGGSLAIRAPRAASARALATRLAEEARRGTARMARRRASLRARWTSELAMGPEPTPAPAAGVAALLEAAARVRLGLAGSGRLERPAPLPPLPEETALDRADRTLEAAAAAADPGAVRAALGGEGRAERAWLIALARDGAEGETLAEAWVARAGRRSARYRALADSLEAGVTPFQRWLVARHVAPFAIELERAFPDPSVAPEAQAAAGHVPPVHPMAGPWGLVLAIGAALGGLGAWPAARGASGRLASGARLEAALALQGRPLVEPPLPAESAAWLHLVSGPDASRVARGVAELAAAFLGRGERVLLVDAGRKLALGRRLGCDASWGLAECLRGELPLAGAVLDAGLEGLHLLAHGRPAGEERWPELGRLVGEAGLHFDRVVLAIEPAAPAAIGEALAGRFFEGWWAGGPAALPRLAQALGERLGILLHAMPLEAGGEALLEAPTDDIAAPSDAPSAARPAPPERPEAVPAIVMAAAPPEPVILDCDLQVRERLRFLIWMRRIQAEGPRGDAQPQTR